MTQNVRANLAEVTQKTKTKMRRAAFILVDTHQCLLTVSSIYDDNN